MNSAWLARNLRYLVTKKLDMHFAHPSYQNLLDVDEVLNLPGNTVSLLLLNYLVLTFHK